MIKCAKGIDPCVLFHVLCLFFSLSTTATAEVVFFRKKYKEFFREKFACLLDGIFVWEWKIQVDKAELFVKEISSCHLSFFLLGLFSKLLVIYQA